MICTAVLDRLSKAFTCNSLAGAVARRVQPMATQQGVQDFSGSSLPELLDWLRARGIDTTAYGSAASKSVDLLWEEASTSKQRRRVVETRQEFRSEQLCS